MAASKKPFALDYKQVEVKDAQERIDRVFALLLAAGRRHRREAKEAAEAMAGLGEEEGRRGSTGHGEGVPSL